MIPILQVGTIVVSMPWPIFVMFIVYYFAVILVILARK